MVFIFLLIFALPAFSSGEGMSESAAAGSPGLPVTRVTLYTAGLAQIVHEAVVDGNEIINLSVEPGDINDILKSLVAEDLDGGTADVVNFHSSDPLSVMLADLRVNPAGSPALADFLSRSQGESVLVITPGGEYSGRIFSIERKQTGDAISLELNLINSSGINPVDITELSSIRFSDPELQSELLEALRTISEARVKSMKTLKISFSGEGRRRIRLSYIRAVPLWKTSYRIVLDENGVPRLEGWAIVQNTGGSSWDDVKLSFVAGQPNAFIIDLATPRYVTRQRVETAAAAPIGPTAYDKAYAPEPSYAAKSRAYAEAPAMEMEDDYFNSYGSGAMSEEYAALPAESRAAGVREGNFYRYEVKNPVTVEARSSAMIPIIQHPESGSTLGVYDPAYSLVFKGIRLENNSEAHWAAGPVTVIEGRYYGGDAMLPEMIPGSSRLLTYAVHGTAEVEKSIETEPQRITALKIAGGILYRTDKITRETIYRIEGDEKELLIIHPKDYGWKLTGNPDIFEENAAEYRFSVTADDRILRIPEEYIISTQYGLAGFRTGDLGLYIDWAGISPAMKKALERITELKKRTEEISAEINTLSSSLSRIQRDQGRIRENMKVLDRESELFRQYSETLASQEKEINTINQKIDSLQERLASAERDLRDYISRLDIN